MKKVTAIAAVSLLLLSGCSDKNKIHEEPVGAVSESVTEQTTTQPVETQKADISTMNNTVQDENTAFNYFDQCIFVGGDLADKAAASGLVPADNVYSVHFSEKLSMTVDGETLAQTVAHTGKPYIYITLGEMDIMAAVLPSAYTRTITDFISEIYEANPNVIVNVLAPYTEGTPSASLDEYISSLEQAVMEMDGMNVHFIDISLVLRDYVNDGIISSDYIGMDGSINNEGVNRVFDMLLENRYTDVVSANDRLRFMYPDMTANAPERTVTEGKVAYLTFDDGPSDYTEEILDILAANNIKATFFITGRSIGDREELIKREVAEGHTIGLHSYSHDYDYIYGSTEDFLIDFSKVYDRVKTITGTNIWCFRYPGGSYNNFNKAHAEEIIAEMNRRGFAYFDWNCATSDAVKGSTYESCIAELKGSAIYDHAVVLMHDAVDLTPQYLQEVINYLKGEGYSFESAATAPDMHFRRPASWDNPPEEQTVQSSSED